MKSLQMPEDEMHWEIQVVTLERAQKQNSETQMGCYSTIDMSITTEKSKSGIKRT